MTYIRHRVRMVHESVIEDLVNTLIACRWLEGTTTRAVNNPANSTYEVVTTIADDVFALVADDPITVINYFPDPASGPPEPNTLAVDLPRPADTEEVECGSGMEYQPYQFSMAFYASSDAAAVAIMSDLQDRYAGRIVNGEAVALFDYLTDSVTPVVYMEVEAFRHARDVESVTVSEIHLHFGELDIVDVVD